MTIRKYSKTTVSLMVIIIGLLVLGTAVIEKKLPYDITSPFLRMANAYEYLGAWTAFTVRFSAWLMLFVGVVDSVLKTQTGFGIFSSMRVPIVMCVPLVIAVLTLKNDIWFWMLVGIVNVVAIAWSYNIIMNDCCSVKRNVFAFLFKLKNRSFKENVEKTDALIGFVVSGMLSAWFWVVLITTVTYAITNKAVILAPFMN